MRQIRYVAPVPPHAATGLVRTVYRQMERDFGMLATPVALHAAAPDVLAACWSLLRETLLAQGTVSRATKELVAAAVSVGNACPYCVDVHGAALTGLAGTDRDAAVLAADRIDDLPDAGTRALARWARASGQIEGRPTPPFAPADAAELIGVAVAFHYLNRMVNIFLPDSPVPAPMRRLGADRSRRMAARLLGPLARRRVVPGTVLPPLPPEASPPDLAWADGHATIADAVARTAAIDAAGERSVPVRVRSLVLTHLVRGTAPPGPTERHRITEAVAELPPGDRAAGELALLTALASYRVTEREVEAFRQQQPADATLIDLTSWASLAAARQVGLRLRADLVAVSEARVEEAGR
ncbi:MULTISPECIES: carboxymuconolactone decarboxylase family protein [Micromonospora]|nr:carboxymuconolactone decarboxylase family protein [Micromonospora sp. NRRL B-16802]